MSTYIEPMRGIYKKGSRAERLARARTGRVIAPGFKPTPEHDLIFNGGKTIPNLVFTNIYVGGNNWDQHDIDSIDTALQAAMSAPDLNNIVAQYFNHMPITSTFKSSQKLSGSAPATVSQGDTEQLIQRLYSEGRFDEFNLGTTVFNLMLPSGTILTDDAGSTHESTAKGIRQRGQSKRNQESVTKTHRGVLAEPDIEEASSSLEGLGGYHGSVHIGSDTVYYAIGVYSELLPDGTTNGIPVFDQPWKNVVATFYHELNEARTDPDVEDAIRAGNDPDANRFLGWVSAQGEECGDFPVFEAHPLSRAFQEVPISSSTELIPIQFLYSNTVHGPEGPLVRPRLSTSDRNGQNVMFSTASHSV